MSEKIPPEERLLNLVVALMATEHGLTKRAILEAVAGYRASREGGASQDALEKMFERDKEQLRKFGAPIETIGDFADPDNLIDARYRIPKSEYELPADIDFTPAELALLQLAGSVWGHESMSSDAQAGLRKIRALGNDVDEPIIGFAPRLSVREASFAALRDAIESAHVVEFDYLKPGERRSARRRLQPLALLEWEARWHVYGVDTDAAADRTFLLSRIVGDVRRTSRTFDVTERDGAGERALRGLEEHAARNVAEVVVVPGSEAALRLARRGEATSAGLQLPFVDLHILADELASYGPEVRVVKPTALRNAVIKRLRRVASVHASVSDAPADFAKEGS